jgi:hypothetical protein
MLHVAIDEVAVVLGEKPVPLSMTRPGHPWVGLTSGHAVHVAHDEASRFRLMAEAERLLWAAAAGLPVPQVVECTASWLVTVRVPAHEPVPGTYVKAAIDAARLIPLVPALPPSQHGPHRAYGGSWSTAAIRGGRLLRSPVGWREFHSLRRAMAKLPHDRLAHGAFHPRNILFDRARGTVAVVDWEFLSYRPAQYDLCLLWPRLVASSDRAHVLEAVLADATDARTLGVVHRWLALRHLADLVTRLPRERWDSARIEGARERLVEARRNAADWV